MILIIETSFHKLFNLKKFKNPLLWSLGRFRPNTFSLSRAAQAGPARPSPPARLSLVEADRWGPPVRPFVNLRPAAAEPNPSRRFPLQIRPKPTRFSPIELGVLFLSISSFFPLKKQRKSLRVGSELSSFCFIPKNRV